ncbi:MAG TPA: RNA methyltransferase [Chitinophagaceae bacterium]|nr:RNA methyltransferase [Chitinophagaceae bacterium]
MADKFKLRDNLLQQHPGEWRKIPGNNQENKRIDASCLSLEMRKRENAELGRKDLHSFREAEKTPVLIVLDNIRSMHNVGSVFRTADAFLLSGIYLCGYTPVPPHRDIHKTALGATETVSWTYFPGTLEAIRSLKSQGYAIWAVEQAEGSIGLNQFQPPCGPPLALIFGNEARGVDPTVLQATDGCLEIPQLGMKHSLNIAVSAGIVIWDIFCKLVPPHPKVDHHAGQYP